MTNLKQVFAGIKDSDKNKKKLLLSLFATLLLVTSVVAIVAGVNSHKNSNDNENNNASSSLSSSHHSHAIIKSACSSTFYPELCFSAISSEPGVTDKVSTHKDVIELSLNITKRAVEHNFFIVEKIIKTRKGLTKREKTALHDCLETIDETLDELQQAHEDLKFYPNKKSLYQHADDLKTVISSAITNQLTCLDGFSHEEADKKVRKVLEEGQVHVEHLCSNALAMTKNMTDNDIANYEQKMMVVGNNNRKLMEKEEEGEVKWPEWISTGDRRLLQASFLIQTSSFKKILVISSSNNV